MTHWKTRPNGDLEVSILRGIVTAIGPDGDVALRLEPSETVNDLKSYAASDDAGTTPRPLGGN